MIKTPTFTLLYNDKSATHDIAEDLIEASFTDHLTGEADELDITLADPERKWLSDWYPTHGATLAFCIGYVGEKLLDCGTFEIDEITVSDSPNTVQIRALSAGVTTGVRTVKHQGFDNQTLDAVILQVAKNLGFSVEGKIEALHIERITQQETDLAFINRLATTYGYMVKVVGKRLIFSKLSELKTAQSIATLDRTDMIKGWRFTDQIRNVPQSAEVTKHNPKAKKTVKAKVQAKTAKAKTTAKAKIKTTSAKSSSTKKTTPKSAKKPLIIYGVKNGQVVQVN